MRRFGTVCALFGLVVLASIRPFPAQAGPAADTLVRHLEAGTLKPGIAELAPLASAAPADPEAQVALGTIRFFAAVEQLGQDFYRHGLDAPSAFGAPLFRMPVPKNPAPEPLTYDALRTILQRFVDGMGEAEASLAKLAEGEIKFVLDLAKVRLDLDGNGQGSDAERLITLLSAADPLGIGLTETFPGPELTFAFDRADAIWLRGYGRILSSFANFLLAHDFSALFNGSFHVLFPGAGLPMSGQAGTGGTMLTPDDNAAAEAVAFIHLVRWPVVEPARMAGVREALLSAVSLSRENWRAILAETDDDREWVPSPRQTSPFAELTVTEERVQGWLVLLDSAEALLEGRILAPHWRFTKGFDVKRVFEEPREFDLVLWLTGQGALPYLADGEVMRPDGSAVSLFEGQLLRYVLWFN